MKMKNIKLSRRHQKVIPIFFATDDKYIPFLDVALRSLIKNASTKYKYEINILNVGLKAENVNLVKRLENDNFEINFCDISDNVKDIHSKLKNVYHFSLATYYRLFIEKLFPQYNKVLYLDCDIVVLGDISKLYNVSLGNNLVGACMEQVIASSEVFRKYVDVVCGINYKNYFNAGILLMNLAKFRANHIEERFIHLINEYNFDVIDPDQGYLNVLCKDRVKWLPNGWNKEAMPLALEGGLNIVHYALYKKPWQYDDVMYGEYFWQFAKESPFYQQILDIRNDFDDVKKAQKEKANLEILDHAEKVMKSEKTFKKILFPEGKNLLETIACEDVCVNYADA